MKTTERKGIIITQRRKNRGQFSLTENCPYFVETEARQMRSYVRYRMHGFNKQLPKCNGKWALTLKNIREHNYKNNPIFNSVIIDEHLTSITFYLNDGLSWKDYYAEIGYELERVTFNIISRVPNICISKPLCTFEVATDTNGQQIKTEMHDGMGTYDELDFIKTTSIDTIYEAGLNYPVAIKEKHKIYKEVFCILQCSDRVVQFLGLYDIMSKLISDMYSTEHKGAQDKVHDFFGKNKSRYPKVNFYDSSKGNKKEDVFTHLRNKIAHSMQIGVGEFLEISSGLTFECIQGMLIVINDILCEDVKA